MPTYRGDNQSELMSFLLSLRERFDSEEEFKAFVLNEVKRLIIDLRSMDIELTLRRNFSGQPASHHGITQKLAKQ